MAALANTLLTVILVALAAVPVESAHADRTAPLVCDANADGVLDNEDFRAIQAARGSPAAGPTDPRDANRNGVIDTEDHRICVLRPMCLRQLARFGRMPSSCETQPFNRPPVADAGSDQTVFTGVTVTLNGSGSSDPDGDALHFRWQILSAPSDSTATLSDPTAVMPTFLADAEGQFVIELVVNDGEFDSVPDTVTVSTEAVNTPPVADAGADQTVFVGATVALDGSGSTDVDGDMLSHLWEFVSLPAGSSAVLSDPAAVNPTFVADATGEFVVQLVVNDGQDDSVPDYVSIFTEQRNQAPVADAGPDQSGLIGDTMMLDGTGSSDPDGDALSYRWSFATQPSGSTATITDPGSAVASFVADAAGRYVVQLIVSDGSEDSAPDTALINIEIGNTPPVADAGPDQTATVGDTVTLDGNGSSDADGDPLAFLWSFTSRPAGSSASLSEPNMPITTFPADMAGLFVVQLIVNDGIVDSEPDTASVTVEVAPNADPQAADDSATTAEDTAVDIDVLANDTDADGDPLTVMGLIQPANGTAVSRGGSVTYTPDADFNGTDSFGYTIGDGRGGISSATVEVVVTAVNDDPVAADDGATTNENDAVTIDVLANDSDVDGDSLVVSAVTQGANGAVVNNGTDVTYTPDADFSGTDSFTYTAADGSGGSDTATVTVTVTPVNDPPVANDDSFSVDEDSGATALDVLGNDSDVDGDALTVSAVTQPANGTVVNNGGDVSYTPDAGFSSTDSFTYTAADGSGGSDTATVTVTVTPVNDPPVANDDSFSVDEDSGATALDVLGNDTDAEGDALTVSAVTQPANGAVVNNGGDVSYTPDADFNGADTFEYTISDGTDTDTAVVTVTVNPVNDDPVATDDAATTNENDAVTIDVLANDSDVDGDALVVAAVTQGANGAVVNNGTDVTYTPDAGFNGTDSFTYTAADGNGGTDTATVTVTVNDINQVPVADAGADQAGITTDLFQLDGSGSSDPDGDTLTYSWAVQTGPSGAAVTFSDVSVQSPTVEVSDPGTYVLALTVSDATRSDVDTMTLTVALAPSITIANASTAEGDSGTSTLSFTLTLSAPLDRVVSVQYATANGTATEPADYVSASGTATFAALATTTTIEVTVNGDTDVEPNENFFVNLAGAVNATIADSQATGTIINDDAAATLTLSPATLNVLTFASSNLAITLSEAAGAGGLQVDLANSNPAVATVPASVTVPEGSVSTQVPVAAGNSAGSTTVTASASGFNSDASVVSVSNRMLDLSLADALVGVGRSIEGTVTLVQPAPAGGVTVALEGSDTGLATVAPASVDIAAGDRTATFTLTGVADGVVTISASAQGFNPDSVAVSVTDNLINLGVVPPLAPGQSASLPLSITSPAPAGGLTVSFASSDPAIATVTASVTIPAGAQIPAVNPQVTGVTIGSVVITATASSFSPDNRDVQVTITFTFSPVNFTVVETVTSNITLELSAPAQAGGLTVPLSMDDPAVATVPPSVIVPEGQTSAPVPVTGVAIGDTVLRTALNGTTAGTANITVSAAPLINVGNTTIGDDLQASLSGSLETQAPAGGLTVTIASQDPSRLLLSAAAADAGSASIEVNVPAASRSIPTFYLQALADTGMVEFTTTAAGYATDTSTVTLVPSGFIINTPGSISTTTLASNTNVQICSYRLNPATLTIVQSQNVRGGLTADVPVTSSDPAVGVITTSPVSIGPADNCETTQFDPVGVGTTTISIAQPASFDTPTQLQSIVATVSGPNVNMPTTATVGENLQTAFLITLQNAPPSPVDVTVTVDDPALAIISDGATTVGGGSVTFLGVTGTNVGTVYVQGLAEGSVTLTGSAPGYTSDTTTVTVQPSGFIINTPGSINTTTLAGNTNVQICAYRLNPATLTVVQSQNVRAGVTAQVPVASSDLAVGVITTSPAPIGPNDNCQNTQFDPVGVGTTTVSIAQPAGFDTPASNQSIVATVSGPNLNMPSTATVGEDLQTVFLITLQNAPPSPIDVTVTVDDPSVAIVSNSATGVGSNSVTFAGVTGTSVGNVYVQGLAEGAATLTGSAPGYTSDTTAVTVQPSGFIINTPGSINTTTFSNNTNVQICAYRLNPATLTVVQSQNVRAGVTAQVPVASSNTTVGVITTSPVSIGPNDNCQNTQFDPITNGTSTISITQPAGFDTPATNQSIPATVSSPNVSLPAATTVGRDLQVWFLVNLQAAPPNPVDVTITSSSPAIATLSRDPAAAGSASVTFTGVTTTSAGALYVHGRGLGTTVLTGQAAGYADGTTDVTVDPSGFIINTPTAINTTAGSGNINVQICSYRLNPTFLTIVQSQNVRGGLTAEVPVASSDTDVGVITTSPVSIGPNDNCENTQFDPVAAGTTTIGVTTPGGFDTPSTGQSIQANVAP